MTRHSRLDIRKSLWICGAKDVNFQRHAARNVKVLQTGGTEVLLFNGGNDRSELENLRQILFKRDIHVILFSLKPYELKKLLPLLHERKNFSIVADDWWQMPYWFMRHADFIFFRKYHGIAVRLGLLNFISGTQPPVLLNPYSLPASNYLKLCSVLRPIALLASPLLELRNAWRRRHENLNPDRFIYMPFGLDADDVPLLDEKIRYDFANTSGVVGIWNMRDAFAPAYFTYTNLYDDRRRLANAITDLENDPFTFYDCRREKNTFIPWNLYLQKTQQSRFVICSGGLHDAALPKYIEYACMGVPMIGRPAPFEHPWQKKVFFPIDVTTLTRQQLKSQLQEALDRYPVMRNECLNLRHELLKYYNYNTILDLAQAQVDGQPIPTNYIDHPAPKNSTC